jgi:hypothetical protein
MLKEDILQAQNEWGKGVVQIGKNELEAKEFVSKMYANEILMKPTLAKEQAFRTNQPDIISYFIGGHISEDNGFALKPWTSIYTSGIARVLFREFVVRVQVLLHP